MKFWIKRSYACDASDAEIQASILMSLWYGNSGALECLILLFWSCAGDHRVWVQECNSHTMSRRQHAIALLPVLCSLLSSHHIFLDAPRALVVGRLRYTSYSRLNTHSHLWGKTSSLWEISEYLRWKYRLLWINESHTFFVSLLIKTWSSHSSLFEYWLVLWHTSTNTVL